MSKFFLLILVMIPIVGGYFLNTDNFQAKVGDSIIEVEIADTPEQRAKGLSGRESLAENRGLLFIYDQPGLYGIWMKEMKFPIDIIWIDSNKKIISISKNIGPESFPEIFEPAVPAQYILEINAGFVDENRIKIGDSFNYFKTE